MSLGKTRLNEVFGTCQNSSYMVGFSHYDKSARTHGEYIFEEHQMGYQTVQATLIVWIIWSCRMLKGGE